MWPLSEKLDDVCPDKSLNMNEVMEVKKSNQMKKSINIKKIRKYTKYISIPLLSHSQPFSISRAFININRLLDTDIDISFYN